MRGIWSIRPSKIHVSGMSLMERADDPFQECRDKFLDTFGRSCLFWLPAQSVNFMCVPPQFRVIYIGACALIWVNILCWLKRQQPTTGHHTLIGHSVESPVDVPSKATIWIIKAVLESNLQNAILQIVLYSTTLPYKNAPQIYGRSSLNALKHLYSTKLVIFNQSLFSK